MGTTDASKETDPIIVPANGVVGVISMGAQLELDFGARYSAESFKQYELAVKSILRGLAVLGADAKLASDVMLLISTVIPEVAAHAKVEK